jgi:hypothetical protein
LNLRPIGYQPIALKPLSYRREELNIAGFALMLVILRFGDHFIFWGVNATNCSNFPAIIPGAVIVLNLDIVAEVSELFWNPSRVATCSLFEKALLVE